jgi:hypothetical protein
MPSGRLWFEVAAVDPERLLGLRARLRLDGRPFDPAGPRPRFYSDSSWGFLLRELPGRRTRVLVSGYAASRPRALTAIGDLLFWGAGALDQADPPAGQPQSPSGARTRRRRAPAGGGYVSGWSGMSEWR